MFTKENVTKYGILAVLGASMATSVPANAAIDVSAAVGTMQTDGTSALTAVGTGIIALAGVALVFRWVKAAFF
jgi:hypothetical protein